MREQEYVPEPQTLPLYQQHNGWLLNSSCKQLSGNKQHRLIVCDTVNTLYFSFTNFFSFWSLFVIVSPLLKRSHLINNITGSMPTKEQVNKSITLPVKGAPASLHTAILNNTPGCPSRRTSYSVIQAHTASAECPVHWLVLRWTADLLHPAPTGPQHSIPGQPGATSAATQHTKAFSFHMPYLSHPFSLPLTGERHKILPAIGWAWPQACFMNDNK